MTFDWLAEGTDGIGTDGVAAKWTVNGQVIIDDASMTSAWSAAMSQCLNKLMAGDRRGPFTITAFAVERRA
jgi:hypothetical protein